MQKTWVPFPNSFPRTKITLIPKPNKISSVQLLSRVWLCVTPWTAAGQPSLSITNSQNLLKLISIELVMPSNNLILCCHLLLLPSVFPSIRVFSNESVLLISRWKCWSFSFSISPSSEYSGLISFRMDWLDLLAVQGTLRSLLQYHSSKASILQHSAAGGQREEPRPWQRSWGRRLGITKGVIKPQETPCSRASNPKTRVCFMLSPTPLTLRGALPHNRFSWRRSRHAAPSQ